MEIKLPYKVDMSVNDMYWTSPRGKFLKKQAKMLRCQIIEDVRKQVTVESLEWDEKKLSIGIIFTENWYCKNGSIKKTDVDNRLKFLIDSVFRGLGWDDKLVFELYAKKEQSQLAEHVAIDIQELQPS